MLASPQNHCNKFPRKQNTALFFYDLNKAVYFSDKIW